MSQPAIVWFRQDLRLEDQPALSAAAQTDQPLILLYILDEQSTDTWQLGGASRWWLHHSLKALQNSLNARGVRLILRRGEPAKVFSQLIEETNASAVFWNRCYEPYSIKRDTRLKSTLRDQGISVNSLNGSLLIEPWEISTKNDDPYKVFTPFWKACLKVLQPHDCLPVPNFTSYEREISSDALADWSLLPHHPDWSGGLQDTWEPGETGAQKQLDLFLENRIERYADRRDFPSEHATSELSPHLHWGEISPRKIWHKTHQWRQDNHNRKALQTAADKFLAELGWREFSYHLLYHFPSLPEAAFNERFTEFNWDNDKELLHAWQKGRTGFPIVDAGMRQLWHCGWMHNRVRMIVASFLTKDLFIHWKKGELWFWDTLVDADLASNSASWQWVAGSGADAAPYFRIFNPNLQGERFDPDGEYIKKWVPELAKMPKKYIHKPWEAPPEILKSSGVTLGDSYPEPVVQHKERREEALKRFEALPKN